MTEKDDLVRLAENLWDQVTESTDPVALILKAFDKAAATRITELERQLAEAQRLKFAIDECKNDTWEP